jgi:hypothetical protein
VQLKYGNQNESVVIHSSGAPQIGQGMARHAPQELGNGALVVISKYVLRLHLGAVSPNSLCAAQRGYQIRLHP